MTKIFLNNKNTDILRAIVFGLLLVPFIACNKTPDKVYNIGIIDYTDTNNTSREEFKAGMAELGYVEGKNVNYIYVIIPRGNDQIVDSKIKELLSHDIDMILGSGRVLLDVRRIVKEDMPILFAGDFFPVETGLVQSLRHPGGNITGVRVAENIPKALEWLVTVADGANKVYLPYYPDDYPAIKFLPLINETASQLGVELVFHKVYSVEETVTSIENLPEDIDAIFMIPSQIINERSHELSRAAIKRGIPTGAALPLDEDVLVTLTSDFIDIGKKSARLAHQIMLGVKPADLPVETGDVKLIINLKTGKKIGLAIPDSILVQATTIIR